MTIGWFRKVLEIDSMLETKSLAGVDCFRQVL
jgi:hypothetical protein